MRHRPTINASQSKQPRTQLPALRMRLLALFVLAFTTAVSASSANSISRPAAHASRALSGTATASLHVVKLDGSALIEEGHVTGILTGTARAQLHAGEADFYGTFTLRTPNGSISGKGTATPHGLGNIQSFRGVFTATSGTGRYAHIHGHAGLYGTLNRRNDSVVVQTQGTLQY